MRKVQKKNETYKKSITHYTYKILIISTLRKKLFLLIYFSSLKIVNTLSILFN